MAEGSVAAKARPPDQTTIDVQETAGGQKISRLAATFESFQMPVYRTVWLGTIMSFLAFNTWGPANGVVAFDLTGNNSAVGFVVFGQGLAQTLLNPLSGAIADRFSRRNLVLGCQLLAFSTMFSVGVLVLTGQINITLLAVGAFIVGSMFSFNGPARNALIADLVPRERLGNAIAMIQVGGNFARTLGPFVAGGLLSWSLFGATGTYFTMAAIMIIVSLTMYRIPPTPVREDVSKTSMIEDIRLGFRHVRGHPRLLHGVISFHLTVALGFSYFVLMPGMSKQVLHSGTAGVGILLGSAAAGGIVTSLLVASLAGSGRVQFMLNAAGLALGLALIATGLAPTLLVAVFTLACVGGGASAFQTLNNVLVLRRSSPEFYGRVMSITFIAWGFQALSGLPIGLAADAFGERTVLATLGILVCASTVILATWEHLITRAENQAVRVTPAG